jgi:hypothetical protein
MNALFSTQRHGARATSVESSVGVLVEIRFIGTPVLEDVVAFEAELRVVVTNVIKRWKNRRAILCTDLRACGVLSPEVSERVIRLMKHDSPHIERSAFLGTASAILSLQLQRVIAESGPDRRRMFKDESPLQTWLAEVANPAEQARLRLFLSSVPLIN